MVDLAVLIAQTGVMAALSTWMFTGVRDNWMYPRLNEEAVGLVVRFDLMAEEFPDEFDQMKHRKVDAPGRVRMMFYGIIVWESITFIALTIGTIALLMALVGTTSLDTARGLAILGATAFTLNWSGFLIGGNHFCYWYCHQGSQHTHFALALWGLLTIILLAIV